MSGQRGDQFTIGQQRAMILVAQTCSALSLSGTLKLRLWVPGMQTKPLPSGTSTRVTPQFRNPAKTCPSSVIW